MDGRDYKEIINFVKDMKSKLIETTYIGASDLEKDFYKSLTMVWEDLKDLDKDDLTNLSKLNSFLIDEVFHIHQDENNLVNEKLMKTNINIDLIADRLEDGRRAFNIYSFNNDSYEYYLLGDIHSDVISLERILEKTDFFKKIVKGEKIRLVFIGDYVDRGASHLKLLQYILTLKYVFPKNIYLQKGNHDTGSFEGGQVKMGVRKPKGSLDKDWFLPYLYNLTKDNNTFPSEMIGSYLKFFSSLAIISFIIGGKETLMVAHGGIPRPREYGSGIFSYIDSLGDLTDESIRDLLDRSIVDNIIWSDPGVSEEDLNLERARFKFTEEDFEEFSFLIGFDRLIRGHQVETKGYHKFFKDRLITIFSSGKIIEGARDINTDTAYRRVNPHIIRFKDDELDLIGLNS